MQLKVGVLGLGIMGSAMSGNMLKAGFKVVGFDVSAQRLHDFAQAGGVVAGSPRELALEVDFIVSVLPSVQALDDGVQQVLASGRKGLIWIESSTLPIEDKERNRALCGDAITFLDCPLSGTGAQALTKDLSVYASGDEAACQRVIPVFEGFARSQHYVGPFSNGSKMKFVANLLVAIHNVSTAEAFVLGMKAGLDPAMIYKVISDGAGSSRMFQVRGPMMVQDEYEPAGMKVHIWQKDMKIIAEYAASLDCPTPLLGASAPYYSAAMAQGLGNQDTASVCRVMENMARHLRQPLQTPKS